MKRRKYELKRRAERQAQTRQRIVEATVGLHTTVGPARTTISAVAERAGVQRHTVYAHFPDDGSLFDACSAHWREQNPFPDSAAWLTRADPRERLRAALEDVYAWYEKVQPALELFARDAEVVPDDLRARNEQRRLELRDTLARSFGRRRQVRAAIGHALEFETWRSLVRRQGLSRRQAVDAMLALVESV